MINAKTLLEYLTTLKKDGANLEAISSEDIYIEVINNLYGYEELSNFNKKIANELDKRIRRIANDRRISYEYSTYVEQYLKGTMYLDDSPEYNAIQIKNIEKIKESNYDGETSN